MKTSTSLSTTEIACKVCQEPSTGVHYGVFSCDACKGFFGRQLKGRGKRNLCLHNNNCSVKSSKKHVCASCRFQKCLDVGMSKNAIKTGRYSFLWRQNLQSELEQSSASSSPVKQTNKSSTEETCDIPSTQDSTGPVEESSDSAISTTCPDVSTRLQPSTPIGPNGESIEEMISIIVNSYEQIPSNLHLAQEYLDQQAEHHMEQYRLKEMLFGKMPTVSTEVFAEIFRTTGLEVDNRIEIGKRILAAVRCWIPKLVWFAKQVPGFKQLHMEDQFNLLKYNRFEFRFFGAYKGCNADLETVVNPNGFCIHKEEFPKVLPMEGAEIYFDVAKSLQRSQLTPKEHILTQTMILLFPDRAPLQDRAAVENLQNIILTCLEYVVSKRATPQDRVRGLSQAMDMLTAIRKVSKLDELAVVETDTWIRMLRHARVSIFEEEAHDAINTEKSYIICL